MKLIDKLLKNLKSLMNDIYSMPKNEITLNTSVSAANVSTASVSNLEGISATEPTTIHKETSPFAPSSLFDNCPYDFQSPARVLILMLQNGPGSVQGRHLQEIIYGPTTTTTKNITTTLSNMCDYGILQRVRMGTFVLMPKWYPNFYDRCRNSSLQEIFNFCKQMGIATDWAKNIEPVPMLKKRPSRGNQFVDSNGEPRNQSATMVSPPTMAAMTAQDDLSVIRGIVANRQKELEGLVQTRAVLQTKKTEIEKQVAVLSEQITASQSFIESMKSVVK